MTPDQRHVTDIFFALLRSGLYGTPIPDDCLPEAIDWDAVMRLAKMHTVIGVVIESVQFLPPSLQPPEAMMAKMRKFAIKVIHSNIGLDRAVARLVTFFDEHGVEGVLLKGQGIAQSYRQPQMRLTGDIDYYVGRSQYPKVEALCRQYLIGEGVKSKDGEKHLAFKLDGVDIEIHHIATEVSSPFRRREFRRWMVDQLERSPRRRRVTLANTEVTLPSLEFDAIFIFYHALRHFIIEGIGLRQLCDWAMIFHTHGDKLDLEQLTANIRRFGLARPWRYFASIAVEQLGVAPDRMPLYDPRFAPRTAKVLEAVLAGGNFGFYGKGEFKDSIFDRGAGYALARARHVSRHLSITVPLMPSEAIFAYLERIGFNAKMLAANIVGTR